MMSFNVFIQYYFSSDSEFVDMFDFYLNKLRESGFMRRLEQTWIIRESPPVSEAERVEKAMEVEAWKSRVYLRIRIEYFILPENQSIPSNSIRMLNSFLTNVGRQWNRFEQPNFAVSDFGE